MRDENSFHNLEIGYNGCDPTDLKTTVECPSHSSRWLAEIIYRGLAADQYNGRYVVIIGKDSQVKIDQFSESKLLDQEFTLPSPYHRALPGNIGQFKTLCNGGIPTGELPPTLHSINLNQSSSLPEDK